MTVSDLIAHLEQYDPNTPVVRAIVHNGQTEKYIPYQGASLESGVLVEGILGRRFWRPRETPKSIDLLVL
jgi:hypothetical protein